MYIELHKAQTGMVIAEDIVDRRGGLLIKKKQILTAEAISVLMRSGTKMINVEDPVKTKSQTTAKPSQTSPAIQVILKKDLMAATLKLTSTGPDTADISKELILHELGMHRIVFGINTELIEKITASWNQNKQNIEIENIATGTPPQAATADSFKITVPHISNSPLVTQVRNARYFWEVSDIIPSAVKRVEKGTVIGIRQKGSPAVPGKNILGDIVHTEALITQTLNITESVALSEDNECLVSKKQGIPFYCENAVGILDLNMNGSIDVSIRSDKMSASLIIHEPADGGSMPSKEEIHSLLATKGVRFGIKEEAILKLLEMFNQKQYPKDPVIVAEGLPARNGENGKVELLFNAETSLKPQQNPDGSVDYKNIKIITSVCKGQKLAKLIPPTTGSPGKNIFNQDIKCIDGIPANLPVGLNTEVDSDVPEFIIASTDGNVRIFDSLIEVSEGLLLRGDVDFSTGNIDYPKSIAINGDIKSGFSVSCGGDLQIGGTIEDCKIKVDGNLLCRLGFIGQGKGLVDVSGNANLSFAKNQVIKCRQNVNIAKEALNCNIYAKDSITIHGKPLSAAGGTLTAGKSITLFSVGNQSGIKTLLEVGVDFTLVEELDKWESQYLEISNNYSKLQDSQKRLEKQLTNRKQLSPKDRFLLEKVTESLYKYKKQVDILEIQKTSISARMYQFTTAFIKIEHSAMPGTLFKFGERHFLVKEEIIGPKQVRLINHEIKVL